MRTCHYCGGGIAGAGEVTGWAGKWCHCIPSHRESIRTDTALHIGAGVAGTPYDAESVEEYMKQRLKDNIKKPNFSHIINLCEQLTFDQLRILIEVLKAMHDCESLASDPNGFKK